MSYRHEDIAALLGRCSEVHDRINTAYAASLEKKEVSLELRLDVKYVCESYRSVLDYLAHDIRGRFTTLCGIRTARVAP